MAIPYYAFYERNPQKYPIGQGCSGCVPRVEKPQIYVMVFNQMLIGLIG